jgi:excisionase family DNA binding protein
MDSAEGLRAAVTIDLSRELIDAIAERVATLLAKRIELEPEPWIGVEQAAVHLACPKSRIYDLVSARRIPHERDGSRLLFRRADLDEWVSSGGGRRR